MDMSSLSQLFIYLHAGLGGIALLAGTIALIAKKGNATHKKSGKVFYNSMLSSALLALVISVLPGHESPFLFAIGVFSSYFLLCGYRSLRFKRASVSLRFDKFLAYGIIVTGILMIAYPLISSGKLNIVLAVFGGASLIFGIRDLRLFRDLKRLRKSWLKLHLGKMMGGYIAAVSAFFVVNQVLPGLWNWFTPGVIGGAYITYWMLKLNKHPSVKAKT